MPPVLLLAGPTASGKSALALRVALATGAWVVNADALQVYADLRVLSARPPPAEEALAPHRLYGHVDGGDEYGAGRHAAEAGAALREAAAAGRPAVVVGGTGLYFRALTSGLAAPPPVPAAVRAAVEAAPLAEVSADLARLDPAAHARLGPDDALRRRRALEVARATGRPLSAWQAEAPPPALAPGAWRGLFLHPAREAVRAAIDARFAAMLAGGALEEARALRARGLAPGRGAMKAHGLPHLIAHLDGALGLEEAAARGAADTRRYARRQVTWARRYMADWTWADPAAALAADPRALLAPRGAGR